MEAVLAGRWTSSLSSVDLHMGYASYLEDVNKRLEDGLMEAYSRRQTAEISPADKELLLRLEAIVKTAKADITRIRNLQDVATDEVLDIAQEVIYLRAQNERIENVIKSFDGNRGNLLKKHAELIAENGDLRERIDQDLIAEYCREHDKFKKATDEFEEASAARKEREGNLLRQESRLLERVKTLKDEAEVRDDQVSRIKSDLQQETNLREILEIELRNQEQQSERRIEEQIRRIALLESNLEELRRVNDHLSIELDMLKKPADMYGRFQI